MVVDGKGRRKQGSGTQEQTKFDRLVKTGFTKKHESLGFVNYFIAQKVRAKVTANDETEGTKLILTKGGPTAAQ